MSGDVSDLVERIHAERSMRAFDPQRPANPILLEAATALEAKEAEIAALRSELAEADATIDAFGKVSPQQYEKELAALRERVKELEAEAPRLLTEQRRGLCAEHDKDIQKLRRAKEIILDMEARAETAEQVFDDILDELGCERNNEAALEAIATLRRKLAEARAALKPFSDAAESLSEDHLDRMDLWESPAGMDITAGQLRAARAVIEKE